MLASTSVYARALLQAMRAGAVVVLVASTLVPMLASKAVSEESLSDLKARLQAIQEELNVAAARVEKLEADVHVTEERIGAAEDRKAELQGQTRKLRSKVIERADALYRSGGTMLVEALFNSESFSEFNDRAAVLSQVSQEDSKLFIGLARSQAELTQLTEELTSRRDRLESTMGTLSDESDKLQRRFRSVRAEYSALKEELAERAPAEAPVVAAASDAPVPVFTRPSGGTACPVAGPVSFIDSWGYPRSGGRSHEGVDMMAAYGTPVVAIVSGTITFAGYGGSAGNWQILSGDDGNSYWYMHNQRNIVTGGHVSVGQQIAEVGDTGNAEGTPHLHFEYHPGGGGPVNPYPLTASIC